MNTAYSTCRFRASLAVALLTIGLAGTARCQDENEAPKPTDETLTTRDGVQLKVTYYSSSREKKAVPVVLLHEHKGTRNKFDPLAQFLQQAGHAVLTVDLRGHGGSTQKLARGNQTTELDAAKFRKREFAEMIQYDMEAVRKFLVTQNDLGKLNLNKLCLVGVEMGATVAINWAAVDWSAPPLPSGKQGQDVKALVLISPRLSFKGIPMARALKHRGVRQKISLLVIYGGQDSKHARDAKRIHKLLAPFHPEPAETEGIEKQELFLEEFNTPSQGMTLVDAGIERMLADFIELRVGKQEYEWSKRPGSN